MRYLAQSVSIALLAVMLSACSKSDTPKNTPTKPKPAKVTQPEQKKSMYAFDEWSAYANKAASLHSVNDVFHVLGMSPKKQMETRDFMGDKAIIFQLRDANQAEFFNVINSPKYMEITWIKPEETDDIESKKFSLENTQKAYQFARSVLGDSGGELVKSMVTKSDFTAPQAVSGNTIKMAVCEHFLCTLVIEKSS